MGKGGKGEAKWGWGKMRRKKNGMNVWNSKKQIKKPFEMNINRTNEFFLKVKKNTNIHGRAHNDVRAMPVHERRRTAGLWLGCGSRVLETTDKSSVGISSHTNSNTRFHPPHV